MPTISPTGIASAEVFGALVFNPSHGLRGGLHLTNTVVRYRAPLINDTVQGGKKRDWPNAAQQPVKVLVMQLTQSENAVDREYAASHLQLVGDENLDLLYTDRVSVGGVMYEVDGPPYLANDLNGVPHHLQAMIVRMQD